MKILNLYACLGGNRYKWDEVANIEVTAVELDKDLAKLYKQRFPKDNVIVANIFINLSKFISIKKINVLKIATPKWFNPSKNK